MSHTKKKVSAFTVVEIILIVILALIMVTMLAFNFFFRKDSVASIFGMSFYNTKKTVTMLPDFPKNTLVIAKKSEIPNIKENSVILCTIGKNTALIRVVEIQQDEGQTYYVVKFDTYSENETFRIGADAVIAKAVWQINGLGAFLDFATSTIGIVIAIIIPLMFIVAIQVARILGIRRLEEEASSIDDIDEIISSRDVENPAPVTFTEPKFIEDVTGKIPLVTKSIREPEAPKSDKILSVDNRGRADYIDRPGDKDKQDNSPLFTYDRIKDTENKETLSTPQKAVSRDELYINKPTRIEKNESDELIDKYVPKPEELPADMFSSDKSEPVVFTPHLSNIIPESIAAVQEETDAPVPVSRRSAFNDAARAYYEKEKVFVSENDEPSAPVHKEPPAIPENAVRPRETIAPPQKAKSNKAVAELMNIIDAEETKLKK
ncbi:MAG: hypothetical protein J1F11_12620 [Oscillospiraceae bacterium]|nr:hypothetical protein [Oscillospiraceae bacterium]